MGVTVNALSRSSSLRGTEWSEKEWEVKRRAIEEEETKGEGKKHAVHMCNESEHFLRFI
jgi:hypothetical protein